MSRRTPAFLTVGALGFALQLVTLLLLTSGMGWPYPVATVVAVEAAILNNFVWHQRWTWSDRAADGSELARRFVRFHVGSGVTSIVGNLMFTMMFVELLAVPTLVANVMAVAATSVANFLVADRWVFRWPVAVVVAASIGMPATPASAAELKPETAAAWDRYVSDAEASLDQRFASSPGDAPEGRSIGVPAGTIHEWRGQIVLRHTTVGHLVSALETPGLPPPADDILDARVLGRSDNGVRLYMKLTRTAIVTVTYDTEHEVAFARLGPGLAESRSIATRIEETGGSDHGFLWRLNSYWRYRQHGDDVVVDVVSLSLSRSVPAILRPVAGPVIDRIGRESMRRALDALEAFGAGLVTNAVAPLPRSRT